MPHQVRHDISFVIPAEAKRIAGIQPLISLFILWGFKPPSERSRDGCMVRGWVVMLSERPNVRVHGDPAIMCPARESRRSRDAKRRGGLSWGYHFLWHAKKGYE